MTSGTPSLETPPTDGAAVAVEMKKSANRKQQEPASGGGGGDMITEDADDGVILSQQLNMTAKLILQNKWNPVRLNRGLFVT